MADEEHKLYFTTAEYMYKGNLHFHLALQSPFQTNSHLIISDFYRFFKTGPSQDEQPQNRNRDRRVVFSGNLLKFTADSFERPQDASNTQNLFARDVKGGYHIVWLGNNDRNPFQGAMSSWNSYESMTLK